MNDTIYMYIEPQYPSDSTHLEGKHASTGLPLAQVRRNHRSSSFNFDLCTCCRPEKAALLWALQRSVIHQMAVAAPLITYEVTDCLEGNLCSVMDTTIPTGNQSQAKFRLPNTEILTVLGTIYIS